MSPLRLVPPLPPDGEEAPSPSRVAARGGAPTLRLVPPPKPSLAEPEVHVMRDLLLTDSERRIALRRIVGFDRLAADALGAVAKLTHRRELAPGTFLAAPGAPRSSVHVVLAGDVRV